MALATAVRPVAAAGVPMVVAATAADAAELISGAVAVSTALYGVFGVSPVNRYKVPVVVTVVTAPLGAVKASEYVTDPVLPVVTADQLKLNDVLVVVTELLITGVDGAVAAVVAETPVP